jgi:ribosomal protein S3
LFKKLTFRDNNIFENLITRAKLVNQLGYHKIEKKLDEDQLKVRFEVLRGQLLIGNDNADIIEELIHIINELFKINKISEQDKNDLINSLN